MLLTLALDVDGVLLDPDRAGAGHWTTELERRHGITREQLQETFFDTYWSEILVGRRALEPALAASLTAIGSAADVEA